MGFTMTFQRYPTKKYYYAGDGCRSDLGFFLIIIKVTRDASNNNNNNPKMFEF